MNNNLSENLKKIRKDNNISQEQLAEDLGVSRQAISKWESGSAYPEMEKIIQLCDKFDLNIDDLLHKDIREIKGEEKTKKDINIYIDSFLSFITDTINMFCSMNFKSKVKCLFEQFIIGIVLLSIASIIGMFGSAILENLFYILPVRVYDVIYGVIESLYIAVAFAVSFAIMIHLFKTRYLDYYKNIKKDSQKEDIKEEDIEEKNTKKSKNEKIAFKKNEDKIIIRDPKHSEYRFFNAVLKLILLGIKAFALFILIFLCMGLVGIFAATILTFAISKTGLFFIGSLLTCIASGVIDIVFILFTLNFVFTRQCNKKKMIWSFIYSVVAIGLGVGMMFLGALDFDIINYEDVKDEYYTTETTAMDMRQDLFFIDNLEDGIEYIEKNINNIEIEYEINKACSIDTYESSGIHLYAYCDNPMEFTRRFIKKVNDKQLYFVEDGELHNVKVYANKDNLKKLKKNYDDYYQKQKEEEELRTFYENIIKEKDDRINELENEICE